MVKLRRKKNGRLSALNALYFVVLLSAGMLLGLMYAYLKMFDFENQNDSVLGGRIRLDKHFHDSFRNRGGESSIKSFDSNTTEAENNGGKEEITTKGGTTTDVSSNEVTNANPLSSSTSDDHQDNMSIPSSANEARMPKAIFPVLGQNSKGAVHYLPSIPQKRRP